MEIKQISIDYCAKSGIIADDCQTYMHTKALPFMSVIRVMKGEGLFSVGDGEAIKVSCGDFALAPAKSIHTLKLCGDDGVAFSYVYMSARINVEYSFGSVYDCPIVINASDDRGLSLAFDKLFASDDLFKDYGCYYDILRAIFSLSRVRDERAELPLERSVDYVEQHYNEKMSVSDLAEQVNLSLSRFYAVFNEVYGASPVSYINNFRLALAAEKLFESERSISDVSSEVGIFDPIYFNKMFRRSYGVSPSTYRKLYRKI